MELNLKRHLQGGPLNLRRMFTILFTLLCLFDHASAAAPVKIDEENLIQIAIEGTRPELTVGTGLGILAEITNLSKKTTVYLTEKHTTLTPAPELVSAKGELVGWWANFPHVDLTQVDRRGKVEYPYAVAALKPGEKITAFWWSEREKRSPDDGKQSIITGEFIKNVYNAVLSELNFIFFSPGDYKVTVSAKYWAEPEVPPASGNYHLAVQSKTFHASAPQSVILLGASIGGFLAYFILPHARRSFIVPLRPGEASVHKVIIRILKEIAGPLAAILVSTIVTILLSRISESQFFIRVTVSDIWGAITTGFVANYAGSAILAKILKMAPPTPGAEATPSPAQQQGSGPIETPKK